jgi:ComF family protein
VGFLDLIFPKTCLGCGVWGVYLCQNCTGKISFLERQFCPECLKPAISGTTHPICRKTYGLDGLISISYLGFPTNKLIHKLKYSFSTDLASLITTTFEPKELVSFPPGAVLVPIPLSWQRKNYRGFNQAAILGKIYAQKLNLAFAEGWLARTENTAPQVGLKREARKANVRGVFEVTAPVAGKTIALFDDVWTTGSTMKNAAQVLKRKGAAKVWALTVARG